MYHKMKSKNHNHIFSQHYIFMRVQMTHDGFKDKP